MSGLVLKLAPNERVLINGAVIENGERRTKIAIRTPNANVLRLKDAIHPDRANTPVARACYIAQLLLSGDADPHLGREQLLLAIEQLAQVSNDADWQSALASARGSLQEGTVYPALRKLRELLAHEAQLLQTLRQ